MTAQITTAAAYSTSAGTLAVGLTEQADEVVTVTLSTWSNEWASTIGILGKIGRAHV